jgi:hypothetical protein
MIARSNHPSKISWDPIRPSKAFRGVDFDIPSNNQYVKGSGLANDYGPFLVDLDRIMIRDCGGFGAFYEV